MNRLLLTAIFICSSAAVASAAPSASFGDNGYASIGANGSTSGSSSITVLSDLLSGDPVVMFSSNPGPAEDLSRKIAPSDFRGTGVFGSFEPVKGVSDGGKNKELPGGSPVVPLPAPAGLAIAGLLFIGSIRRR